MQPENATAAVSADSATFRRAQIEHIRAELEGLTEEEKAWLLWELVGIRATTCCP